jgi:hypothetical protein
MSLISNKTKGKAGLKASKTAAKHPRMVAKGSKLALPVGKAGMKAGKPLAKRRVKQRAEQLDRASRTVGEVLAVYAPQVAYEFGLAQPPKPKRMAPRILVGVVIGATAMYFLEPGHGKEHREKVAQLAG